MWIPLLLAVVLQSPSAVWSARVTSANGRFQAELRAAGARPEVGERLGLEVFELRPGDAPRRIWVGLVPHELGSGAQSLDLLSDDGAAFVRLVARPAAGVLVREILKGTPAMQLRATDLELAEDAPLPWIELASGLRWRPDEAGINVHWLLDLLGHDGLVRTLDLDQGTVHAVRDETLALDLTLRPPVPEMVLPATLETSVDDFGAQPLLYAGDVVEIDGHGHVPSGGWRFIGFQVIGDPRAQKKLVLVPRGVPPKGAVAQVVERHLWTARVGGLPPGVFQIELCGAETSAADPRRDPAKLLPTARTVELVSPHQLVELRTRAPAPGALQRVALFDDGRFELDFGAGTRSELASLEEWQRLDSAVRALSAADVRSSAPAQLADAARTLTWRAPRTPRRNALAGQAPAGLLVLAEALERSAARFAPAPNPPTPPK